VVIVLAVVVPVRGDNVVRGACGAWCGMVVLVRGDALWWWWCVFVCWWWCLVVQCNAMRCCAMRYGVMIVWCDDTIDANDCVV
jgi:hypothetical protein